MKDKLINELASLILVYPDGIEILKKFVDKHEKEAIKREEEKIWNILRYLKPKHQLLIIHRIGLFGNSIKQWQEICDLTGYKERTSAYHCMQRALNILEKIDECKEFAHFVKIKSKRVVGARGEKHGRP